jgi:signal transduction histidine kinase
MCGGTLHIKSRVGEGTVAEIRIPTGESKEKTP